MLLLVTVILLCQAVFTGPVLVVSDAHSVFSLTITQLTD